MIHDLFRHPVRCVLTAGNMHAYLCLVSSAIKSMAAEPEPITSHQNNDMLIMMMTTMMIIPDVAAGCLLCA